MTTLSDLMDVDDFQRALQGAFEKDTEYRLVVEAARYWVIQHYILTGKLPEKTIYSAYPNGTASFDWGDPPGPDDGKTPAPLRGKRVRITLEIEDHLRDSS